MKQPLNALIVKEGEGKQEAVAARRRDFHVEGNLEQLPGDNRRRRRADQHGHVLRGCGDQRRFAQVSTDPLRVIVFTQGHADHVGGWSQFDAPGIETIVQANHADVREYWRQAPALLHRSNGKAVEPRHHQRRPVLPAAGAGDHDHVLRQLTRSPRRPTFELYSTPGGETTDSLVVWLPEDRTVFTGNLSGPLFGHIPNLYTLRGDKYRSAIAYIHSVDRVIDLGPERSDHRPRRADRRRGGDPAAADPDPRRHRVHPRPHVRGHELRESTSGR